MRSFFTKLALSQILFLIFFIKSDPQFIPTLKKGPGFFLCKNILLFFCIALIYKNTIKKIIFIFII